MNKKLKIGVDYHGVITSNPDFFKTFNSLAIKKGFEVYVVTGGKAEEVKEYLNKHHIPASHIFSVLDYFQKRNLVTLSEDGLFHVPDILWDKAKANFCIKQQIDIHIDDSMTYGIHFQTPFCLYSAQNQKCQLIKNNIPINFNQPAQNVLKDIEEALDRLSSK